MRIAPLVLLCVCFGWAAGAEIYRWTDANGTVHMTQDLHRVPPEHRDAAHSQTARCATTFVTYIHKSKETKKTGRAKSRISRKIAKSSDQAGSARGVVRLDGSGAKRGT